MRKGFFDKFVEIGNHFEFLYESKNAEQHCCNHKKKRKNPEIKFSRSKVLTMRRLIKVRRHVFSGLYIAGVVSFMLMETALDIPNVTAFAFLAAWFLAVSFIYTFFHLVPLNGLFVGEYLTGGKWSINMRFIGFLTFLAKKGPGNIAVEFSCAVDRLLKYTVPGDVITITTWLVPEKNASSLDRHLKHLPVVLCKQKRFTKFISNPINRIAVSLLYLTATPMRKSFSWKTVKRILCGTWYNISWLVKQ